MKPFKRHDHDEHGIDANVHELLKAILKQGEHIMATLKSIQDSLDTLTACISSTPVGTITQAEMDALAVQIAVAQAACTANHNGSNPGSPSVNAGADQTTISIPESVNLTGTVSPRGNGSLKWSKVSGPGDVTFSADTALNTVATFNEVGTYVLRLTYTDGIVQSNDITITVQ